jgi:hypothetical protein
MKSMLFDSAYATIESWLAAFPNAQRMSQQALAEYPSGRDLQSGWTLDLSKDLGPRAVVRILLPSAFPFAAPLLAVSSDRFLAWPHVEMDGVLCLLDNVATTSPYRPLDVVRFLLREAVRLIKDCERSGLLGDFRSEFHSYWNRQTSDDDRDVISCLDDTRIDARMVSLWAGKRFLLVGETEKAISAWLAKRFGEDDPKRKFDTALCVSMEQALTPPQYPTSSADIAAVVRAAGGKAQELFQLLVTTSLRPTVILRASTPNGTALAAVRMDTGPQQDLRGRRLDQSTRGFRPQKIKQAMLASRLLQRASKPNRYEVTRADAAWIHGRGKDLQAQELFSKRVLLFGAGSLGAAVAEMLAQSGVGKLMIVDPQKMVFANASRHVLGVDSEGSYKATAVASLLQRRFPHHDIQGHRASLEDYMNLSQGIGEWDCIVSLTGDWAANTYLNETFLRTPSIKRLAIGWSEAHAVAGHAVLLNTRNACLVCGYSDDGLPRLRVAEWDNPTIAFEPACGGAFQPYGAVEVAAINAMIAGSIIGGLVCEDISDFHCVYVVEEELIRQTGGALTEEWITRTPNLPRDVKVTKRFPWEKRMRCEACGGGNAIKG